jgi:hypothetical protein
MGVYGKPDYIADGVNTDIDTTEEDILEITEGDKLVDSQLTVYYNIVSFGTNTSIEFRYYCRFTVGGDWYELPYRNEADGAIASVPTEAIAASTPAKFVDSLPLPACVAFKITGKGIGGGNSSIEAYVMSRDN